MIPTTTPGVSNGAVQLPGNDSSVPKGKKNASGSGGDRILVPGAAVARLRAAVAERAPGGPTLGRAVEKAAAFTTVLTSTDGLDSAMTRMLQMQSQQTRNQVKASEAQIRTNCEKASDQNKKRLKALREMIEAEADRGFWDTIGGWFRDALNCLSAVASVSSFSPMGAISAAMIIASVVVARTKKDKEGMWISMGLGMAGGCMSTGNARVDQAKSLLQDAARGAEAVAGVPRGLAEGRKLDAEANLVQTRATRELLKTQSEQEREMLNAAIEAQNRGVSTVLKVMANNQKSKEAATAV
jgi:hypothetical protein